MIKNGPGTLMLTSQNTYGGMTTVNVGILNCLGGISGPVTVAGGTLGGIGTIGGAVTNQSGGTIAPGANASSIGTLTINNSLALQPGSTTLIKIGKNGDGGVNDVVTGLTSLSCGGTIMVTNISGNALAAGDTFPIFSAANYKGSFSNAVFPALGVNLSWINNLAVNGTMTVVSSVSTVPTNIVWAVTSSNLTLSWPADHIGWRLLRQTNHLANGISLNANDWDVAANSQLTNQFVVPINSSSPEDYFRLVYP